MTTSGGCACGAPTRCWPDSETCAFMDTGYPWCRVCRTNHRAPECTLDSEVASTTVLPVSEPLGIGTWTEAPDVVTTVTRGPGCHHAVNGERVPCPPACPVQHWPVTLFRRTWWRGRWVLRDRGAT